MESHCITFPSSGRRRTTSPWVGQQKTEFSLDSNREYTLGTDTALCDIVFQDTSVSRQHAKIIVNENNALFLEDLDSRNGTAIEGNKIKKKEPLPLNTILALGTTLFVVYDREDEMQTIVSPFVPSLLKSFLKEEKKEAELQK